MARNQVAPDRYPQMKNNFAGKPNKIVRKNHPEKNESNNSDCIRARVSGGSNSFFVKPSRKLQQHKTRASNDKPFEGMSIRKYQENSKQKQPGSESKNETTKKPFDKKKYRLKKYSNKYKLEQWGERRKTAVIREYYKQVKDDQPQPDVSKIYNDPRHRDSDDGDKMLEENENNLNSNITQEESLPEEKVPKIKLKPFQKAQQKIQKLKEEKEIKREEFLKKKAEKEEALKKYRKEKAEKYKKLSRRTKKGQPIMKGRIEMLLEKIQSSM